MVPITDWLDALRLTNPPQSEWVADAIEECPHTPQATMDALKALLIIEPAMVDSVAGAIVELENDSSSHFCSGPPATCEPDLTKLSRLSVQLIRSWWGPQQPVPSLRKRVAQDPEELLFQDLQAGRITAPISGTVGRTKSHRTFAGFQVDLDPADDLSMQMNRAGLAPEPGYWVRASYPTAGCQELSVPTVVDAGAYAPFLPSAAGSVTGTTRALNGAPNPLREVVHRPIDCVPNGVVVVAAGRII